MSEKQPYLSVVIPVYNEAESISKLHREVITLCREEGYNYEIIIVDDGSSDETGQVVKELSPVIYIRLRRNFGQTSAMDCGIKQARGELIVTMDGDGQNDPADIPKMIKYLQERDLDVFSDWRRDRKDSFMKKLFSGLANYMRGIIIKDGLNECC